MKTSSPLRYPGGKSALAGVLSQIRKLNGLGRLAIAEPFGGGAGASLTLLFLEETESVYINDADPAIRDFWWAVRNRSDEFSTRISEAKISMAEWRRQRDTYRSKRASKFDRAFATFYLNRCNRSGIIMNGGPIGGIKQAGKWKLGARFNRPELRQRCERIAEYGDRIHVSGEDGIKFIRQNASERVMFFIDPPYFEKGRTLYLNALDSEYHNALGQQLREQMRSPWVLTYDDCPEIRKIYRGWTTIHPFSLRYNASERRSGREILIAPKWMRLPSTQLSEAIGW
jgi:DNA adenine methylase